MGIKKIIALLMFMFLLSLILVSAAKAETRLVRSFDLEGIGIKIFAPQQAYPGDNITLQTIVESKEELRDVYVTIGIHGSISEGYDRWTEYITVLEDVDFSTAEINEQNFTVNTPSNVSSGLVYGHIYCRWKVYDIPIWKDCSHEDSFEVTYLRSKEFEQLQAAYDELLANYTKLKNYKNELGTTRNLMYIFVATTVVSAVTAFILLIRGPKRPWA